ncbi:hypothetical protein [Pseudoxanthomonas winnipegensis]|uniref:Uncharacterized protein n=1 Tax=Pseudoxanthomonas winnipegensis TaxID=2480810 RepID=A0A4Q8L9V7_9GAMM|nr:hypothetical protein [Pseudoxanthomonas winnipegensis]RZZ81432.1 hypothetical protein EA663_20640 [Pseudoxanthomonas winnipegensis]TAA25428.1 hypothetical protein EA660_08185 [Pseudoxanthomonas winnipegensis]
MGLAQHELKALAIQLCASMPPLPKPMEGVGEFLTYDLRRLRKDAIPKWRAREGEGKGVSPELLDDLLKGLVVYLGRSGASDSEHEVQTLLSLVRRVMGLQHQYLAEASGVLARLLKIVGEVDESTAEDLEQLRVCLEPISLVWSGQ